MATDNEPSVHVRLADAARRASETLNRLNGSLLFDDDEFSDAVDGDPDLELCFIEATAGDPRLQPGEECGLID